MIETQRYSEMFDYLSSVPVPAESAGTLVFGRNDPLVAHAAGETAIAGLSDYLIISGGVGKDSGDLTVPEADFLASELSDAYPQLSVPILIETKATNGGENVRNSLEMLDSHGLAYRTGLIAVAHATSARRLMEMARHEALQRGTPINGLCGVATRYPFNPEKPADQQEACAELLRLADWPAKGWLQPQDELPENLVDFVRDNTGH